MGMTIEDIKHCLKVMVDCEVCEECNLYGTTGTDHCEHDCVYGALDIIDKYQLLKADYENRLKADMVAMLEELKKEIEENGIVDFEETYVDDGECIISVSECNRLIQQKINALKGEGEK